MQGLAQNDLQGAIPENVVLSAGELQKTFTINLSDDTQNERQESFSVQLGRPTGGASLGQQFSQTVRVKDNDPQVFVNAELRSVDQSNRRWTS